MVSCKRREGGIVSSAVPVSMNGSGETAIAGPMIIGSKRIYSKMMLNGAEMV